MDYEERLTRTYSRLLKAGDTVIDVGAFIGRHSTQFSSLVGESGHVFSFEPLTETYLRLAINMIDKPNVTTMCMALGEDRGLREFIEAVGAPEESGLRERLYNTPDMTTPVSRQVWCETLDHVLGDLVDPRYIKIDVEGAELSVLKGAETLVQRSRPTVSVEWGAPTYKAYDLTPQDLWAWTHSRTYIIYDINLRKVVEYDDWNHLCEVDQTIWDFWLVPSEKEDEFRTSVLD